MAVIITDNRVVVDQGDAITNWTGAPTLFIADPDPVETTGCIGYVVSAATVDGFYTLAPVNLSNKIVYVWVQLLGAMDTILNGGASIHLGDGTNRIAFHLAGSDAAGFRHDDGPVGWQCLVVDTSNLPSLHTVRAGSLASLNLSAITQIGATFKTLAKSKGGTANCFVDIIRYGDPTINNGAMLTITGGTLGDAGKFSQIASNDRLTSNLAAHGIIRQLGAGAFGIQGALRFGDSVGTTSSFFADTNTTVVFENRGLSTTRYSFVITGNSTGSTTFKLGLKSGTGDTATGTDGCSLVAPTGVGAAFIASNANLQFLQIYGSTLSGFTRGITLSSNITNGPNHEFLGNVIANSGIFDPGLSVVRNCRIVGWTGTSTDAALLWGTSTNVKKCAFTSSGTGHAIKITAPGTYSFDGMNFSGYGANDTTDAALFNDSGGAVIINVINGGDSPTIRNGAGASTTVNNAVSLVISGIPAGAEWRLYEKDLSPGVIGTIELDGSESHIGGDVTYAYNYIGNVAVMLQIIDDSYEEFLQELTLTQFPQTFTVVLRPEENI